MESKLKRFGIYHPENGFQNILCKVDVCEYEYVASVEAENLVKSFYKAQNDFNPAYAAHGIRSTSVGDIIAYDAQVYMVNGSGYKRIPKNKELYRKIMESDEAIIERLSHVKLTEDDINDLAENSY